MNKLEKFINITKYGIIGTLSGIIIGTITCKLDSKRWKEMSLAGSIGLSLGLNYGSKLNYN